MTNAPQTKQWYQTAVGATFLGIFIFFIVAGLAFFGFVTYYSWQLKFGDKQQLAKEFKSDELAAAELFAKDPKKITEDITKLIYPTSPVFGTQSAPVTILAFIDFECPFSRESYPIFKQVMEKYGSAIKVVFKHLPIATINQNAVQAHLASTCAQEQNKFWEYYNILFSKKELSEESLIKYANDLKLNIDQFKNCLSTEKFIMNIQKDLVDATKLEVRGTPTFFVNQTRVEGVVSLENWDTIILDEITASK